MFHDHLPIRYVEGLLEVLRAKLSQKDCQMKLAMASTTRSCHSGYGARPVPEGP